MAEPQRAALSDLAERHAKRSRAILQHFHAQAPDRADLTRAHLASKIQSEYEQALVLPEVLQARQGPAPPIPSKPTELSGMLDEMEVQRGVAKQQAPTSAVAIRPAAAAKATPASASHLQTALMRPEEAVHDTGRSMLNSALIRKKELAQQQAKPAYHAPWRLMRVVSGHLGWVRCVAVDPHNRWFATGAGDRMIKIWDMASGELKLSLTGHISPVRGLAVSQRHPYLFSAGEDKLVKCWDLETNKVVRQYYGHLSGIYALSLHPTLDVLVTAGRDASARVWDMRTKTQIHVLGGHRGTVASVVCQESDPQVLTGSMDATIKLWDLAAGRCVTTLTHHKKSVRALALPPHEFTFASGSAGGHNIKRWRCPEGTLMTNMTHEGIVNTLSCNADGVLFSGADDGSMQLFDYATGVPFQSMRDTVQPGSLDAEAGVFCSAFDQTGTRLITGCADKSTYATLTRQRSRSTARHERGELLERERQARELVGGVFSAVEGGALCHAGEGRSAVAEPAAWCDAQAPGAGPLPQATCIEPAVLPGRQAFVDGVCGAQRRCEVAARRIEARCQRCLLSREAPRALRDPFDRVGEPLAPGGREAHVCIACGLFERRLVRGEGLGVVGEREGQEERLRAAEDEEAEDLGGGLVAGQVGVAEAVHPREGVVVRVVGVHGVGRRADEAEVRRRDAEVREERGNVAAGAEGADVIERDVRERVDGVVEDALERRRRARAELRATHGRVEMVVYGDVVVEAGRIVLAALGRSDVAVRLGAPAREHDRARRPPAAPQEVAEAADDVVHDSCAGRRISGAEAPRIAAVAGHDALRVHVPGDDGVHVPDIARRPLHLARHVRPVPTRAGPVRRVGYRAAKVGADGARFDAHALHVAQEALCMQVRDRQGRDARQRDGRFAWSALYATALPRRAVVRRISVQQHADGALRLRRADGPVTKHTSITNQGHRSSNAHAERLEAGEVGVRSGAGVDDAGVGGAGGAVRAEGGGAAHDVVGEVGRPHR